MQSSGSCLLGRLGFQPAGIAFAPQKIPGLQHRQSVEALTEEFKKITAIERQPSGARRKISREAPCAEPLAASSTLVSRKSLKSLGAAA